MAQQFRAPLLFQELGFDSQHRTVAHNHLIPGLLLFSAGTRHASSTQTYMWAKHLDT